MELETLQNNMVAIIVLATLIGFFLGWLTICLVTWGGPSKRELTRKLKAAEEEFDSHKASVDQHFAKTSELVNDLTESYVKVYKHLSDGAEQLGGVADMRHRLTLDKGEQQGSEKLPIDTTDDPDDEIIEGSLASEPITEEPDSEPSVAKENAGEKSTPQEK